MSDIAFVNETQKRQHNLPHYFEDSKCRWFICEDDYAVGRGPKWQNEITAKKDEKDYLITTDADPVGYENIFSGLIHSPFSDRMTRVRISGHTFTGLTRHEVSYEVINLGTAQKKLAYEQAIEDSRYIRNLKADWDTEGARGIAPEIFDKAIQLLTNFGKYLYKVHQIEILAPSITPLSDGSIDIFWLKDEASLLINIPGLTDEPVYYYGQLYDVNNDLFDIRGHLPNGFINEVIKPWFTYFQIEK